MKIITRHTDFAVQALCYLHKHREARLSAGTISRDLRVPLAFIRGVLQRLQTAGLLVSVKGAAGGFSLSRPADKITLREVMEIFQGSVGVSPCFADKGKCARTSFCTLNKKLAGVQKSLETLLASKTIEMLCT